MLVGRGTGGRGRELQGGRGIAVRVRGTAVRCRGIGGGTARRGSGATRCRAWHNIIQQGVVERNGTNRNHILLHATIPIDLCSVLIVY